MKTEKTKNFVEERSSRRMGKNTFAYAEFFIRGKAGQAVIFATPKGNFLSPKAVENILKAQEADLKKI